jgi:Secretion system C-terminal sorting domain
MLKHWYKNYFLIVLFSLIASLLKAQTEYIVSVNSINGNVTKIDSISTVRYLQSSATYNQTTKEYTVIGVNEPGQSNSYLYTLNAETGKILFSPILPSPNKFISLQYSRSTGVLYGIIYQSSTYYLVTINKVSGTYAIIHDIPNIDGVGNFTIDETNQFVYLRAVDNNPNFTLLTIDLQTGNIIKRVTTLGLIDLIYDNVSQKIYAFTNRPGTTLGSSILSVCTVNPNTGLVSNIADLPMLTGIISGYHGTINENDHLYLLAGAEDGAGVFLYSIDTNNGNIISKVPKSTSGVASGDNLIFFRYDNIKRKLYALLWEAITTKPTPTNSSCNLSENIKVFPNPVTNVFTVDKKNTTCEVKMNLYNSVGQLLWNDRIIKDGINDMPINKLSNAVYYYKFISNNNTFLTGAFIKH